MKVTAKRIDFDYVANFRRPLIEFAAGPAVVVRAMVDTIGSRYPIASGDIVVEPGRTVADVHVSLKLFNGNVLFEMNADRFSATVKNAVDKKDMDIVQDCLTLAVDSLLTVFPKDPVGEDALRIFLTLGIDEKLEGSVYVQNCLGDITSKWLDDSDQRANERTYFGLRVERENLEEKWHATFGLDRAHADPNGLFMMIHTRYWAEGKYRGIAQKFNHALSHIEWFSKRAELQIGKSKESA